MRAALLLALAVPAASLNAGLLRMQSVVHAARAALPPGTVSVPPDQYFEQPLDHFEPLTGGAWRQRFWTNASFWAGAATSPVFIYIEGEGSGSPGSVLSGQHVELAAAHGALLLGLEHRFYGASNPTPTMTTAELRTLSSQQALADLARFISAYLVPTFNLNISTNKVVTFGGSYPGALSAWARLTLPHLVSFAFSTSSPVQAVTDFQGYCDVVSSSFSLPAVGGSPACRDALAGAFAQIDAALRGTPAQAAAMAARMHSCTPPQSLDDIKWLASNIAGQLMGVVQYNEEVASWPTVASFCAAMDAPGAQPLDVVAAALLQTLGGAPCQDNSYANFISSQAGNTTVDAGARGVGIRQWTWQTCSQFSYFQTCEQGTRCPFSSLMDFASQVKICQDAFSEAMDAAFIDARVRFTNAYLGGFSIAGATADTSRVLFTNGGVDPWASLSVRPDNVPAASRDSVVWIPTGAHCRQMRASSPNDPADVVAARAQSAAILAAALKA